MAVWGWGLLLVRTNDVIPPHSSPVTGKLTIFTEDNWIRCNILKMILSWRNEDCIYQTIGISLQSLHKHFIQQRKSLLNMLFSTKCWHFSRGGPEDTSAEMSAKDENIFCLFKLYHYLILINHFLPCTKLDSYLSCPGLAVHTIQGTGGAPELCCYKIPKLCLVSESGDP